jgi:hypothetical protein
VKLAAARRQAAGCCWVAAGLLLCASSDRLVAYELLHQKPNRSE